MIMYILQGQNGQELRLNICLIFLLQLKDCKMETFWHGGGSINFGDTITATRVGVDIQYKIIVKV